MKNLRGSEYFPYPLYVYIYIYIYINKYKAVRDRLTVVTMYTLHNFHSILYEVFCLPKVLFLKDVVSTEQSVCC